jgi:hypothetical protein
VTPVRPTAVRASLGGAVHSLSRRAGFKVGRRLSIRGVDFFTPRRSDGRPLTQSTMWKAFQRRELSAIYEDDVEDREDEDGDELTGLAEEDFPALDGRRSTRGRSSSSSSSRSSSSNIGSSGSGSCSHTRFVSVSVFSDVSVASVSAREVDSSNLENSSPGMSWGMHDMA